MALVLAALAWSIAKQELVAMSHWGACKANYNALLPPSLYCAPYDTTTFSLPRIIELDTLSERLRLLLHMHVHVCNYKC